MLAIWQVNRYIGSMELKYSCDQRREYINFTRKMGAKWVEVFQGNTEFYSADFWDLLTEMWYINKPVMVSDALRSMKSIKSPFTARKYLQKVIEKGIVLETKNPEDERSTLVELSAEFRADLDQFFDTVLCDLSQTVQSVCPDAAKK